MVLVTYFVERKENEHQFHYRSCKNMRPIEDHRSDQEVVVASLNVLPDSCLVRLRDNSKSQTRQPTTLSRLNYIPLQHISR